MRFSFSKQNLIRGYGNPLNQRPAITNPRSLIRKPSRRSTRLANRQWHNRSIFRNNDRLIRLRYGPRLVRKNHLGDFVSVSCCDNTYWDGI